MGRQIGLYAFREDMTEFLDFASTHDPIVVTLMDSDQQDIRPLPTPADETRVMTLWNHDLIPSLRRSLVKRPGGSDYYRVSYSQPVLELSPSRKVSWNERPALLRGRLYGFSFEGMPDAYATWYDVLSRWIRSHFTKNPVEDLDGYIGKAALAWFNQGGVLLPAWPQPPVTPQ
jgi:hypothetical protein